MSDSGVICLGAHFCIRALVCDPEIVADVNQLYL